VDEPPHLLLWSADELAPMLLGLTIGVIIGKALICFLGGLLVTNLYRRFRDNHPDGYLLHMIYWAGFIMTKAKSLKNPFVRRYLP
ncbi:type IV conjugative transfer system protein TraL, partial [Salmonella enterica subsp. enterica serovar Montevideo]